MCEPKPMRKSELQKCVPSPHLYFMAPMKNASWIRVLGIYSHYLVRDLQRAEQLPSDLVSIADCGVISRRRRRSVGGVSPLRYVAFYRTTHTPMQYVVTMKERRLLQDQLAFFVCDSVKMLRQDGVWTSDGNVASGDTQYFRGAGALEHLDRGLIASRTPPSNEWWYVWKRMVMAEVLLPGHVPRELIEGVVVRTEAARKELHKLSAAIARRRRIPIGKLPPIEVRPEYYYD